MSVGDVLVGRGVHGGVFGGVSVWRMFLGCLRGCLGSCLLGMSLEGGQRGQTGCTDFECVIKEVG